MVEALISNNHTDDRDYIESIMDNENEYMNDSGISTWHVRPLQKDCAKMKVTTYLFSYINILFRWHSGHRE